MSFNAALSGLQAATVDLDVTSNNIANVSTTGFKQSRAAFADLVAVSPFGVVNTVVGGGVEVTSVDQQFEQGNLEFTTAPLDLAVSGEGFFILRDSANNSSVSYTRAGQFGVDANGFIGNSNGELLQFYPVDSKGTVTSTSLNSATALQLPTSFGSPQATTKVDVGLNLDATSVASLPTAFDPTVNSSYAHSTSTTVIDSLGTSHVMSYYFVHDQPSSVVPTTNPLPGDPNQWAVFTYLDGAEIDVAGGTSIAHNNNGVAVTGGQKAALLNFSTVGALATTTPAGAIQNTNIALTNGAAPLSIVHDFANNKMTQFASGFAVSTLAPDGFSTGRLTGLDISDLGFVRASFSNGVSNPLGQIALADFPNNQGLEKQGGTNWSESINSGSVITGSGGTGRFGLIQSGALESSNVDLTAQLVNLITAQRNFQANARSIETSNSITDTVIQIR